LVRVAEIYPWENRHGHSSGGIPLTHQAWIQQLKYTLEKSGMDTAAEVYN
jgi:hypothetical protein